MITDTAGRVCVRKDKIDTTADKIHNLYFVLQCKIYVVPFYTGLQKELTMLSECTAPKPQIMPPIRQTYQMLARHLADADHPDCVWGDRLVIEGSVHEGTGAGRRSLVVFGCHRIVCLQEGLRASDTNTDSDNGEK